MPGVQDKSLTTRPINELLPKIEQIEQTFVDQGICPKLVVCGGGAAGVELCFTFKTRWEELFKKELDVTIVTP